MARTTTMKPKLIHYESEYKMLFLKRFIAIFIAIICYIIQITVPYSHNMSYIFTQSRVAFKLHYLHSKFSNPPVKLFQV